MRNAVVSTVLSATLAGASIFSGCETYGEGAGLGAAVGATAGAIIGHQSGNALAGAAIGAAVGGIGGLIAHDIKVHRARTREETAAQYNYQPTQGEVLTFEEATVLPSVTAPGKLVETSFQYALLGAPNGVRVQETRQLFLGDQLISDLSSKSFDRTDGTWVSAQQFTLPGNLQPGRYAIVQRVTTPTSTVSGRSNFTVQ
ncbi:MAG: hypothetical protein HYV27_12945 [Candidatus Hydrogenedentes bacterium]|nr:hypothetical protein [Candidatus Hydrogenedentota bacterium]